MIWFSYFFYITAIVYELTDKVFDGLTVAEYHKEKLFDHPKKPVYGALLAFMIFGCLVSTAHICLYIWKMFCIDDDDEDESDLDRYYQCSVCVHAVKVIIEAFPQSVIAYIAFDGCPIKSSNWRFLDIGFDVFCIAPYVIFICSMSLWYCCGNGSEKGKYMSFLTALATVFSIPGCVLALISFAQGVNCP